MSAPHLFANSVAGDRITIEGDDAHHAVRVLRLRPGERVTVSDGSGRVADGVVAEAGAALVVVVSARRTEERVMPLLSVMQGIPKTGKLELIVQKLTELGVDEIVPVKTKRSVGRLDEPAKLERLRVVAREAAKQSHRAWLPRVGEPIGLESWSSGGGLCLVLHEEASQRLITALPEHAPDRIALFVGPEGGFAREEVELLAAHAEPVSLGTHILRTETAALVATALILGHYGRIG